MVKMDKYCQKLPKKRLKKLSKKMVKKRKEKPNDLIGQMKNQGEMTEKIGMNSKNRTVKKY